MLLAIEPKTVLLIGQGPDNHPRGTHEYGDGLKLLGELLEKTPDITVRHAKADEPSPAGPKRSPPAMVWCCF